LDLSQTGMPVSCEEGCDCPSCSVLKPAVERRIRTRAFVDGAPKDNPSVSHHKESASPTGNIQSMVAMGLEALDCLNIGLLVTTADCRLLRANRAGQRILQAGKFVSVDPSGILRTIKGVRPTLADIVRKATEPNVGEKSEGPHLLATVRGIAGTHGITMLAAKPQVFPESSPSPAVPLILFSPSPGAAASSEALNSIFSFTSAEAIMANLVMEGLSRNDCGSCLKIRPTTVAFHLKNMFRKTGSRCQAQLISKLFKAIGLIQAASTDAIAIRDNANSRPLAHVADDLEYGARNHRRSVTRPRYLPK
jgi:DNA-binding CsgD family transcriptional regulator